MAANPPIQLVVLDYIVDNTQKYLTATGSMSLSGGRYLWGGTPLDSVLLALPGVTTNSGVRWCSLMSKTGSGYIYQRIPSTGMMMILQVPPNGSLATAAPFTQYPIGQSVSADTILFEAQFKRNT
jgi:hypothetical protein